MTYMAKDFTKWHKLKSRLDSRQGTASFNEREIWWCSAGMNIGNETDGKNEYFERPMLIIRKLSREIFWAMPLTTRIRKGRFYYTFMYKKSQQTVILSQLKALSWKRLQRPMGKIDPQIFREIKRAAGVV